MQAVIRRMLHLLPVLFLIGGCSTPPPVPLDARLLARRVSVGNDVVIPPQTRHVYFVQGSGTLSWVLKVPVTAPTSQPTTMPVVSSFVADPDQPVDVFVSDR